MKDFNSYMDNVKAEEELKEKTKIYVENVLTNNNQKNMVANSQNIMIKGVYNLKKSLRTTAAIIAFGVLAIGGYVFYNTPVNYLCMDINPSVELGINAFDRVVKAEGINEDGKTLLAAENVLRMKYQNALSTLVMEAAEQGYIFKNGSTVIAVTALSDDDEKAVQLKTAAREKVEETIRTKNMVAIVYDDCGSLKIREQAKVINTSAGKFRLMSMIQKMDPSFNVEQYKNAKMYELITKANELISTNGTAGVQSKEYERTIAMVKETVKKMQEVNKTGVQEQNTNMILENTQNQGTTNIEQNMNQVKESESTSSGSTSGGSTSGGSTSSGSTSGGSTSGGSTNSGSTSGGN